MGNIEMNDSNGNNHLKTYGKSLWRKVLEAVKRLFGKTPKNNNGENKSKNKSADDIYPLW